MSKESKKPATNKALEQKLEDALERIKYLEDKVDGTITVKKEVDNHITLSAMKSELLTKVDEKSKDLLTKQEEFEETKNSLEKRIRLLERKLKSMEDEHERTITELREELSTITGSPVQVKDTTDLERKLKQLDQKRKKDNQEMQDDVLDLIEQKLIVIQKEKGNKIDRMTRELQEINKRLDVHDEDLIEMTKVIQELDRDRIQDGKATQILKQEYDLLDERIDNISEAILELNTMVTRNSKIQVDHNDLNVIKEACLQDFNTLNQRITDVSDTVETIGAQVEHNEKEIDALKMLKQPRLNMNRKDISSPLRSSMSYHLGSNLNKRRSDSASDLHKIEHIQRIADHEGFAKVESRNVHERESVLSHSRINKYLGDSFEEVPDVNYKTNNDRVIAYKETARRLSQEKDQKNKFQKLNQNLMKSPAEDQIIIEDIDSDYESRHGDRKPTSTKQKHTESKQSELTFKADEIFNDKSEQESNQKDSRFTSLEKKKTQEKGAKSAIDLTNKKHQPTNVWDDSKAISRNKNILLTENQPLSGKFSTQQKDSSPYRVQLGPVGGDTLDEESSEGEFESSDLSMEDNQYLQGHIVQKHQQLKNKGIHNFTIF